MNNTRPCKLVDLETLDLTKFKLEKNKIEFEHYTYECDEFIDGAQTADLLGLDHAIVYKTLVTVSPSKEYFVFVIGIDDELDLKAAAKSVGQKSLAMIQVKDINNVTGYIRGGCSPVGMKKKYPTFFEESCQLYDEIAISAGERGHQMILPPLSLVELVNGTLEDIIV